MYVLGPVWQVDRGYSMYIETLLLQPMRLRSRQANTGREEPATAEETSPVEVTTAPVGTLPIPTAAGPATATAAATDANDLDDFVAGF